MFLCLLPAGAFRSEVEFGYISPHFAGIVEANTNVWTVIYPHAKFEKAAPVILLKCSIK